MTFRLCYICRKPIMMDETDEAIADYIEGKYQTPSYFHEVCEEVAAFSSWGWCEHDAILINHSVFAVLDEWMLI